MDNGQIMKQMLIAGNLTAAKLPKAFGTKAIKPFYKKTWFTVIAAIVVFLAIISSFGNKKQTGNNSPATTQTAKKQKQYAEADINVLIKQVKENAAAANKNYKGKNVKIVNGTISNIESGASYIVLQGTDRYSLINVQCFTHGKKALKDVIVKLKNKQDVTVYGTITDVGEIMGYSLDLDKIEN